MTTRRRLPDKFRTIVAIEALRGDKTAKEIAAKIATKSSAALKLAKQAINKGMQTSLQDGLDYEYEMYALALSLEDKAEGVSAFLEKRAPKFVGR